MILIFLGQEVVDFTFAHLDLGIDLTLAQPRQRHLGADILAQAIERHAVGLESATELANRKFVAFGHASDGAIELNVVDLDAAFLRVQ